MKPLWTIIMTAVPSRKEMREELLAELWRQAEPYPGQVEILVDESDRTTGDKAQDMLHAANGSYISSFDDDDEAMPGFIDSLIDAMEFTPDIITYDMLQSKNEVKFCTWQLSLKHKNDWIMLPKQDGLRRWGFQTNQLCPTRIEIARLSSWPSLIRGVDQVYTKTLRLFGALRYEVHVDKVLYHYRFGTNVTMAQTPEMEKAGAEKFGAKERLMWQIAKGPKTGGIVSSTDAAPYDFIDRTWTPIEISVDDLRYLGRIDFR